MAILHNFGFFCVLPFWGRKLNKFVENLIKTVKSKNVLGEPARKINKVKKLKKVFQASISLISVENFIKKVRMAVDSLKCLKNRFASHW